MKSTLYVCVGTLLASLLATGIVTAVTKCSQVTENTSRIEVLEDEVEDRVPFIIEHIQMKEQLNIFKDELTLQRNTYARPTNPSSVKGLSDCKTLQDGSSYCEDVAE